MKYRIEEILAATKGEWPDAPAGLEIGGWSIDSRTIRPGELFFAFRGGVRDGHEFVEEAFANGAAAACVRSDFRRADGGVDGLFLVDDGLEAMHRLAAWSREQGEPRIIGITGSCGKTTTKDIAAALLPEHLAAAGNGGNYNNVWGMPLELLRRPDGCRLYVCEMGMSYAGELRQVARIARPDVAVYTNIRAVHQANFASVDQITEAKAELLEGLAEGGSVVANADDSEVMRIANGSGRRVITYGIEAEADLRATDIEDNGIDGTRFVLRLPEGTAKAELPLPGIHNIYNLLAALGAGIAVDAEPREMLKRIDRIKLSPMRSAVIEFADGWTLLNDAYNSNPTALAGVLGTVAASGRFERRIAVLGDMLELGPGAAKEHWRMGELAASLGIERLITLGPLAVNLGRGAIAGGMPAKAVRSMSSIGEVVEALRSTIKGGELVLVKGSRGMRMERIVEALQEDNQTREIEASERNS